MLKWDSIFQLNESTYQINWNTHPEKCLDTLIQLHNFLMQQRPYWLKDWICSFNTVSVYVNDEVIHKISESAVLNYFNGLLELNPSHSFQQKVEIPICIHDAFALDKKEIEKKWGMPFEEGIHAICTRPYTVYLMGFLPGFGYMGFIPHKLKLNRLNQPRTIVPAGSVAIADELLGIYPFDSPGGWNIIGRTPISLFNPKATAFNRLSFGATVQFKVISLEAFHQFNQVHD